ncbi:restriction endonuclease subunit S [Marinomonas sp.]|uniref:restriction endonuclease subunit S n=1 Tax=Marinomonas sp. TaxID=1904862 RepID=UPI003BAB34E8
MSFNELFGSIPKGWESTTLGILTQKDGGSIQTGPFGSQLHAADYVDDGIPSIMPKNITIDGVDDSDIARVKPSDIQRLSKYTVAVGDIVYSRRGDVEKCSLITEKENGWLCGTGSLRVRVNDQRVTSEFLHAYLCHPKVREWIVRHAVGATMPNLNTSILSSLPVLVPSEREVEQITKIWTCLSKKLIVNSKTNQTLESMAQAIFKSWFVDFDPVKAKMRGEQPAGMDETIAALFPDKLVESELGMIPEGWNIQSTESLFEVKDGTHDSPQKSDKGYYLVTSKHITKGKIDISSAYLISQTDFEKVNQRSKVETFDILLTMIGTVGEVVIVYDNPVEFAIKNVGLFKTSQRSELVWLFYWHLQSFKMKNYLEVRMAGTTQQYLTLKSLRTIPVILPSDELLGRFNEVVAPLMEKIFDYHKQNQTLSNLRDTLLPKLLSGELSLDQAQDLAELLP